jgi:tetratricopeptide (TPR) repeat protein
MAALADGDLDAVQAAVEGLRDVEAYDPHRHLFEGALLLRNGRPLEAVVELGYAKDHPDTAGLAYSLSGESLYKAGRFRDADRILTAAVQRDPSLTDAHRWLAVLYYDIGAMNHASEQLKIVAEQAPDDPRPHRTQGLISKDFQLYEEAIAAYQESLRLDPDQPDKDEILLELAECLLRRNRHAELRETLARCPRSARTLTLEAESRLAEGDREAARKLAAEALDLSPDDLGAVQLRARLDLESNDPTSALKLLQRAAKRYPRDYRVHSDLAQAYERLGQRERAREEADIYREIRDLITRFTKLHRQAIAEPANADIRYQLGQVALQFGKPELARSWFLATLAMAPDHAGAREALRNVPLPPAKSQERR